MRVTRKLILAIVAAVVIAMTGNALVNVRREAAVFEADTRRDHEFIGRTLRAPFVQTWLAEGEARAEALIRAADQNEAPVRVRVVHLRGGPDAMRPRVSNGRLAALARGEELNIVQGGRSLTYIALPVPGDSNHALELSESMAPHDRYVRESTLRNVLTTLLIVVLCTLVAVGVGVRVVGSPLAQLARKARRVGEGDLGGPLYLPQDDEVGELAREMNAMCERLADAQRAISEQAAARVAALEQLRHADRLRTVGQLASGLAHELGTPLNVVLGRAGLLAAEDATLEDVRDNARIIAEQTQRMTALIRQLLDFARRRGPAKQTVDLRDVAAHCAELLAPLAQKASVSIELRSPSVAVRAQVDPGQIQQVVTNLVVNALQAMPGGGVVRIETGERQVAPPAEYGGTAQRYAFVAVTDQGGGVPPERLSHVFEPFYTTKDVGEGTGLGLSVAYGIARDHGGWLAAESQLGQGSVFTLFVPRGADGASADEHPSDRDGDEEDGGTAS